MNTLTETHRCTPDDCHAFAEHDYEGLLDAYQLLYEAVGPALRTEADRKREQSRAQQPA